MTEEHGCRKEGQLNRKQTPGGYHPRQQTSSSESTWKMAPNFCNPKLYPMTYFLQEGQATLATPNMSPKGYQVL